MNVGIYSVLEWGQGTGLSLLDFGLRIALLNGGKYYRAVLLFPLSYLQKLNPLTLLLSCIIFHKDLLKSYLR
jgi:hypothetical protein